MLMFLFLLGLVPTTLTLDNGLALTPPMGWMTWQRFRRITDCEKYPRDCISEELIKRTADKLVEDGYLEAGYEYLIIDDCWSQKHRSSDGRLMPDRKRFKSGMKALADYIHSKGFKFGMYQNYSNVTCAGYPGIMDYEDIDIASFVEWEIDYLKLDACYIDPLKLDTAYPEFGRKLNASGRPIVFSCSWPAYQESYNIKKPNYTSIAETCNLWRVLGDIEDSWAVLSNVIDWYGHNQDRIAPNAGPGQWNDPDMARIQMAIWAIMAAPLLISVDLDDIRPEFKEVLLNKEVIYVNQDVLGKQGLRVYKNRNSKVEIWSRELADRSYAVAFISKKDYGAPYPEHNFTFTQMKLPEGKYKVRDLYLKENVPSFGPDGTFPVRINPTGVKFFKFIPKETENEVYNK
ncbi:alpha-N-acetylgalactosaminidase-like isoform X2 [Pectinophora gossypiella]|uniref:alpha-N-acetylgalactosaminidase-like isoform X2 n=1 Tax=Pectinophora gossypiella TaxID=13191 RepID=UPI00214F4B29|nr:alpha-N-acetylgalactosaminidase-like isoform X2 [Pectinophora gossypiella]